MGDGRRGARIRVTTLAVARAILPHAWCDTCDWSRPWGEADWPAVRASARRHAVANNHVVNAEFATCYVFGATATGPEP